MLFQENEKFTECMNYEASSVLVQIQIWAYIMLGIILETQSELPFKRTSAVVRLFLVES